MRQTKTVSTTSAVVRKVSKPNAATVKAMKEARSRTNPRFSSARELFDDLERGPQRKTRKTAKKVRVR